jgi:hypothetical protein
MSHRFVRLFAVAVIALLLMACQPVMPEAEVADSALATFVDPDGFYTLSYPEGWTVDTNIQEDFEVPFPGVTLASDQEIVDKSLVYEPLPEGQIGIAMMLVPSAMFAEMGVSPDTPLEEVLGIFMVGMADDEMDPEAMLAEDEISSITLANGAPAAQVFTGIETEDYEIMLVDLGDGVYLFAPQILAVDYRNAELEAQVDAILDSFVLTGSGDEVMEFVMAQMEAMGATD